ncbi:FecR family protein [uncultured Polaribacter sp.]|uniref:FecR family protein n=1 Tax=uncultured Polaribacter sp. TaxID=174711 RepID=UPI0026318C1F|nr:FecR family protein [uncultured Polaribacter sp.]
MNENIEKKIVKFLMNAANIDDLEVLTTWLQKKKNKQLFKDYIRTNYAMDININPFDTEKAKREYLRKIRQDKKKGHTLKIYTLFKYAAAAVLIFGLGYFYQQGVFKTSQEKVTPIIVNNKIETGSDKATLTLEDGLQIALVKGTNYKASNATSNGEKIVYLPTEQTATSKNKNKETKKIVYNTLTIPRGGQFQMILADGTQVWLNSESQIKYPIAFTDGKTRQVELIYGEAYFNVSPSAAHKGSTFKVLHKLQEVTVLGTEFNIKGYKDETTIYTTLVEGKVAVNFENKNKVLKPSEQSNLNTLTKTLNIAKVDVYDQISWKKGVFSFERIPLKEIMKVLSRWYDVEVLFANKSLEEIRFIGALNKNQSIVSVLNDIKNYGVIDNYEINEKRIVLR